MQLVVRGCSTGHTAPAAGPHELRTLAEPMGTIPLSPIDHIFTGAGAYPIEFVFAYGGSLDEERLRSSLDEVVRRFPPVSSRLVPISPHAYGFEPAADGLVFRSERAGDSFAGHENSYAFLDSVSSQEGEPLARIKLTHTPGGSVLGVSISHAIVDGFSYFFFLTSWARAFRGEPLLEPVHQRELLVPETDAEAERIGPHDVFRASGVHWGTRRAEVRRERLRWDRATLSREAANRLLRDAQAETGRRLSLNDTVSAYLWKTYVERWDDAGAEGPTLLACPVDVRRTLRPFPLTYFGCAVQLATAAIDRDQLRSAALGDLAARTRSAVASVDKKRVHTALRTLEALRRQEGLPVLEHLHVIPPDGLLVTNLSRLPVREIAFDAGPPVAFDILTPAERGAVILPAEDGFDIRVFHPVAA